MNRVQVGILCHKPVGNPLLERCLQSLAVIPAGVEFELLLQLTPGSNAENLNRLLDRVTAPYVCILEDDTAALRPMWLRSLVDTMDALTDAAIVMPIETKDGVNVDPGFRAWMDRTTRVPATYGFCNLIKMSAGLRADERLKYFVDIDLAWQAIEKGFSTYCNGHVRMLHGSPNGRLSSAEDLEALQADDRAYLETKWKGKELD